MNNQVSVSRRGFLAGLGALSAISVAACSGGSSTGSGAESQAARFGKLAEVDGNFTYNAADDSVEYHHSDMLSPNYYVFAGKKDADGAAELVGQLGLVESIEAYVGQVTVVNPKDGDAYTTTTPTPSSSSPPRPARQTTSRLSASTRARTSCSATSPPSSTSSPAS